uniref:Uncharacterized protein n=1 Tax=Arundo donax TaxID=35708 RepID=A0A0A9FUT8_ARUDO
MSVLESGFPPLGSAALPPPSTLVRRRMNVLFPHPESAASPITTVLSAPAEHDTRQGKALLLLVPRRLPVPAGGGEQGDVAVALVCTVKADAMDQLADVKSPTLSRCSCHCDRKEG